VLRTLWRRDVAVELGEGEGGGEGEYHRKERERERERDEEFGGGEYGEGEDWWLNSGDVGERK
jgi:hypothetical protein